MVVLMAIFDSCCCVGGESGDDGIEAVESDLFLNTVCAFCLFFFFFRVQELKSDAPCWSSVCCCCCCCSCSRWVLWWNPSLNLFLRYKDDFRNKSPADRRLLLLFLWLPWIIPLSCSINTWLLAFSPVAVVSVECECDELETDVDDLCSAEAAAAGPVVDDLGLYRKTLAYYHGLIRAHRDLYLLVVDAICNRRGCIVFVCQQLRPLFIKLIEQVLCEWIVRCDGYATWHWQPFMICCGDGTLLY